MTVWGALLGWLRERAGGLLAPIFAHVVADLAISWIVLVLIA
jgi:membrane protease YdiL (CAAX protease family)